MDRTHHYRTELRWTGDRGEGTRGYAVYGRDYVVRADQAPELLGSADPAFRGDPRRWNPEQMLVGALSACHMLWYLHLCAVAGIRVVAYADDAEGTMEVSPDGSGRFTEVVLRPRVFVAEGSIERARTLHEEAARACFIASSVNFPVRHEPTVERARVDGSYGSTAEDPPPPAKP